MLIATIPPPHRNGAVPIAYTPEVDALRFNTGVSVPSPRSTIKQLRKIIPAHKPLWIDLKCKQLRVNVWADARYTEVELNRNIQISLPALISFRGGSTCEIAEVHGNKIFLTNPPDTCVGKGQSVNILSERIMVEGPLLSDLDHEYVGICADLGIKNFMASFINSWEEVDELVSSLPGDSQIYLKVETEASLNRIVYSSKPLNGLHLELARDDLVNEMSDSPLLEIVDAMKILRKRDSGALIASRFFNDLQRTGKASLADIEDALFAASVCKNFMFQDSLSENPVYLREAAILLKGCVEWVDKRSV